MTDVQVLSSGATAAAHQAENLANHGITLGLLEKHGIREFAKAGYGDQLTQSRLAEADITICMNQRVYDESLQCVRFPASPRIWSVADIGEPGRISQVESERQRYREEAYLQIAENVDQLISDIFAATPRGARLRRPPTRSQAAAVAALPGWESRQSGTAQP